MTPKKIYNTKQSGLPKIDVPNTKDAIRCQQFCTVLRDNLEKNQPNNETDVNNIWSSLKTTIHDAAIECFGKKTHRNKDWFEAYANEIYPTIENKNKAHLSHIRKPSAETLKNLREARSLVQRQARHFANLYWSNLCIQIQQASDTGNTRAMFDGIKQALGPSVRKTAPLKSKTGNVIIDKTKQMERWVEHYCELYSKVSEVTNEAIDAIHQRPTMTELDEEPDIEELSKALDAMNSGKAPGKDAIPAEVLKCGKNILLPHLHDLLIRCWRESCIPQDMKDATISTLYKNKGDRGDCNNYRGISLLSITGKLFAQVILKRLQKIGETVYPESQCGFRAKRSTTDMIFSLRQLQEKCKEQQQPLYIAFVDLTKAFDTVSRDGLFKLLAKIGCPPKLLCLIRAFHDGMQSAVNFEGTLSDWFPILNGVKQGCVLAAILFCIFFSLLLSYAFDSAKEGIYIHTRSDGKLYNMNRLRAVTKRKQIMIQDLLFADDAALVAHSETKLQNLMDRLSDATDKFGLTISVKKTVVMGQDVPSPPVITLNNTPLEVVDKFCYLGSSVSENASLDEELNVRIGKAASTFGRLTKRAWNNGKLTTNTKISIYRACVLSTLLYGSETWTTYSYQERKLNSFHMRCLRRILNISWQDKVTNEKVLETAKIPSVYGLLKQRRLRWLGHVRRMDDSRIPKDLIYGEIANAKRPRGRPALRFKDCCKRDMKSFNIPPNDWERLADHRQTWKYKLRAGIEHHDYNWFNELQIKRQTRTSKTQTAEVHRLSKTDGC